MKQPQSRPQRRSAKSTLITTTTTASAIGSEMKKGKAQKQGKQLEKQLLEAAQTNQIETVQALLAQGVDPNCRNNLQETPLRWAANYGYVEVVRLLLEHGADSKAKDTYGWTSLEVAVDYGHAEVVQLLLCHGAEPNVRLDDGSVPLHWAAKGNHTKVIQLLLEAGADPWLRNKDGKLLQDLLKTKKSVAAYLKDLSFLPRRRFLCFLNGLGTLREKTCPFPSLSRPSSGSESPAAAARAMERALWSGEQELVREICSYL